MQIVIEIPDEKYDRLMYQDIISLRAYIENGIVLPKGHGRLIDVDALPEQIGLKGFLSQDNAHLVTIDRVKEALSNAPTIISAESEE